MTTPEKREELKAHFKNEGIEQAHLMKALGVSQQAVSALLGGRTAFGKKTAATWAEKFGLNAAWLLTGEGEMLKNQGKDIVHHEESEHVLTGKLIPFFDAEAAAGNSYAMSMEVAHPSGMIEIGAILKDSETALRVYGNSMIPNYPPGSVLGLKLHTDSFIVPGHVYVVETRDNRYLKRLYTNKDYSALRCLSDNHIKHSDGPMAGEYCYPEFEIPVNEVIRIHRVVGIIKRSIL